MKCLRGHYAKSCLEESEGYHQVEILGDLPADLGNCLEIEIDFLKIG